MRLTLLFLFLFKSVIADDESDEKYIDNLPDDEKRDFLEKIARRILQDYQNNNVPKNSSVNISDEALSTHTAYVQSILKEERTKTNKTTESREKKDSIKKKEEHLRKSSEKQKFIDLTMRASKRDKRKNLQNESYTNDVYIPVIPLYDTNIHLNDNSENQVQNNKNTAVETTSKGKLHDDDNSENYSKNIRHSFVYDDSEEILEHKSTVIDNFETGSSDKNKYSSENIREDDTKYNYQNNSTINLTTTRTTEGNIISRKDNNGTDNASKNHNDIKTIELQSEENLLIINTTLNSEMIQTTDNFTTITDDLETTTVSQSITFKEHSTLDIIKHNPELVRSKTVLDGHVLDKHNINQKNNLKNVTSLNSSVTIDDRFNKTTTGFPTESSSSQTENCAKVETTINKSTEVDPIKNTKPTNESTHENFHGGRKTYPEQKIEKAEKTFIKDLRTIESSESGTKENKSVYFVYEVSAERPPFVTRNSNEDKGNEHPYYAPVYNYSPENAYYDPNNRYGPNENDIYIDENQDSLSKLRTFVKDIQRGKFKSTKSEFLPVKLNLNNILKHKNPYDMLKPLSVITDSNNYNPYDYIDMDYFFGRNENLMRKGKLSENNLPNTEENDHPYSNYKEGHVKDHVRAVRKLLFSNQMFGYIPSVNEKRQTNTLRNHIFLHDIFHNDNNKYKDDIAIDYYFGRQNSEEEIDNKFNYDIHKFQQIKPMTPIPIERKQKQLKTKLLQLKEIDVIEASCNVLKDFIKMDNELFANYDWLRTAVDVQSALEKLYDLTEGLNSGEHLHPYDLELLKYVIYLYKSSQASSKSLSLTTLQSTLNELRKNIKKKSLVPKIKKQKKGFKSAVKMWKDFATFLRSLTNSKKEILFEFQNFLSEVQLNLNDLHEAIKYVGMITTYKSQNWHADLKNLYFQHADRRKLLTILLHLSTSRLFGLIEDTKNVLEDSFSSFIKNNKEDLQTARDEFIFVLKLLDELKKIY